MTNEEIIELAHAMQQPGGDEEVYQRAIALAILEDRAVAILLMLALKLMEGKAYNINTPDQEKVRRCREFADWFGATVEEVPQGSTFLGSLVDAPLTSLVITPSN